mgnify:FL=1
MKLADTLELHEEGNKKRESHIPVGEYLCELVDSPKFGNVYEVKNVHGRGNVLIHSANFAGDTNKGLDSDLLGCIAVGSGYGKIDNHHGKKQFAILNSRKTLKSFMEYMLGQPFILVVIN